MEVSENTGVRIGEATVDMFGIEFMCSEAGNLQNDAAGIPNRVEGMDCLISDHRSPPYILKSSTRDHNR